MNNNNNSSSSSGKTNLASVAQAPAPTLEHTASTKAANNNLQRQMNPQMRQRVSFRKQNAIIASDLSFLTVENDGDSSCGVEGLTTTTTTTTTIPLPSLSLRQHQRDTTNNQHHAQHQITTTTSNNNNQQPNNNYNNHNNHNHINNICSNNLMAKPPGNINKPPSLSNLNVPVPSNRKMSLQASSSQQQQLINQLSNNNTDHHHHHHQHLTQNSTTITSSLSHSNSQSNIYNSGLCITTSNNSIGGLQPNSNSTSSNSNTTTINNNGSLPGSTKNSLSINNQLLMTRKSLIGSRLERSSFQAQRLSDVGVAVSQQLTAKIGLKLPASQERIVEQTRWLYLRYVLLKLRQNGLPLRDLNLTKSSMGKSESGSGSIDTTNVSIGGDTPVPEITCSAPASAAPTSDCYSSDGGPILEFKFKNDEPDMSSITNRERSRMSKSIVTEDISFFATTRLKSISSKSDSFDLNSCSNDVIASLTSSIDSIDEKTFFKSSRQYSIESKQNVNYSTRQLSNHNNNSNHRYNNSSNSTSPLSSSSFQTRTNFIVGPATNRKYILDTTINQQIFNVILNMICDLRELKPEYYGDTIYELVGIDKFSCLQNLLDIQMRICQEMTRSEITWCRIAALFSLFGAMSLDCVRLGAPEHVGPILEGFLGFVERDLALWISQQGGWESFLYKHKASFTFSYLTPLLIFTIIIPIFAWGLMDIFR